jgi:hypothetical protein
MGCIPGSLTVRLIGSNSWRGRGEMNSTSSGGYFGSIGVLVVSYTSQYLFISLHSNIIDKSSLEIQGKGRGSVVAFMVSARLDDKVEYSQIEFMFQLFPIRFIP